MGLYDVAMVKDNHKLAAGSVAAAYSAVRQPSTSDAGDPAAMSSVTGHRRPSRPGPATAVAGPHHTVQGARSSRASSPSMSSATVASNVDAGCRYGEVTSASSTTSKPITAATSTAGPRVLPAAPPRRPPLNEPRTAGRSPRQALRRSVDRSVREASTAPPAAGYASLLSVPYAERHPVSVGRGSIVARR